MERVLKIVQQFDPPGIGARDLRECLLLQLDARGERNSLLRKLVDKHIDDIGANRIPVIARKMKIPVDEVLSLMERLKKLSPAPAISLSTDNPLIVVPEVSVTREDDRYIVSPKTENIPKLRISSHYLQMLEDPACPKETKEYIRDKLIQGKMIMKSMEQRKETLMRIAEVIVDSQSDFFERGIEFLHPLTMQEVADKLDIHETTVSRAISGKYIETPSGTFGFKFFFSTGYQSDSGEEVANKAVKEKIRDIIAGENAGTPLTDQEISEILKKNGLDVARRTVAKYREAIGIPSARLRKEFT